MCAWNVSKKFYTNVMHGGNAKNGGDTTKEMRSRDNSSNKKRNYSICGSVEHQSGRNQKTEAGMSNSC